LPVKDCLRVALGLLLGIGILCTCPASYAIEADVNPTPTEIDLFHEVSPGWGVIGKWYVKSGDNHLYADPDYTEDNWTVMGSKTVNHLSDTGGVFWYRAWFEVPSSWSGMEILLRTGWIADTADIYLNGVLVDGNVSAQYSAVKLTNHTVTFPYPGRMPKTLLDISRTYRIDDLLNGKERNLLAIRLRTNTSSGGLGMVGIGPEPAAGDGLCLEPSSRILLLGDSITDQSATIDSYPRKIWDALNALFPASDITIINMGRNAETSGRATRRIQEIVSQKPDLVIVNLGVNDVWWANINESQYADNIEMISREIEELTEADVVLSTATPILLANGTPARRYPGDDPYGPIQQQYNSAIQSIATREGYRFVDFNGAFHSVLVNTSYEGSRHAGYLLQRDGIHPNPKGASLMALAVLEEVIGISRHHARYLEDVWNYGAEATRDNESPLTRVVPGIEEGWLTSTPESELIGRDPRPGSGIAATFISTDDEPFHKYRPPLELLEGEHNLSYFSVDNSGNVEPTNRVITRLDTRPPEISLVRYPVDVSPDQSPQLVITVKDSREITSVICHFTLGEGTQILINMTSSLVPYYECVLPRQQEGKEVSYYLRAQDRSGHWIQTPELSYTVPQTFVGAPPILIIILIGALMAVRRFVIVL